MKSKMRMIILLDLLLVAAGAYAAGPAASPVVSVAPARITVSGVTPRAQVLIFGVGTEPKGTYAITRQWSAVVDSDADGNATYVLDPPVRWNALWVVADLRNAHYTVTSTTGFPVVREHLTRRELKRDTAGSVAQFVYSRSDASFLYLTPGGGWTLTARDGDTGDADHTVDGAMTLDIGRLEPVSGPDRLRAFNPGGTLLAIDLSRLDLLELKIDGSLLAGAR